MVRKVLLISDCHLGSIWAIFPPDFKTSSGNSIKQNDLQYEIYEKWQLMKEQIGEYDTVFLLGDICNGLNKKEFAKHQVIADLNEQIKGAIQLLKPICKKKNVIAISGSGYHGSVDYEIDEIIAKALKGKFLGTVANVRLKGTNQVINIGHGGGSAPVYFGTKLSKEILQSLVTERLLKIPEITGILRAHNHTYAYMNTMGKHIIFSPCWEGARKNTHSSPNYFRFQPDLGAVKLIVDENNIQVKPFLYTIKYERNLVEVI